MMDCFRQLLEIFWPCEENTDTHVDWSNLPDNVLWLVKHNLLIHIKDYIRFGAVCKSWRSVYIDGGRPSHPRQLPLLMLPNRPNTNTYSFYSLTGKKLSSFKAPVDHNLFCAGSSYGWLATVSPSHEMSLVNPFLSPPGNTIQLPPVPQFVLLTPLYCYFTKIVLSANPASTPNYVAMVVFGGRLAYFMPGNKTWTMLPCDDPWDTVLTRVKNIIYYKDKFHVVDNFGEVHAWDIADPNCPNVSTIAPGVPFMYSPKRYIVESSGDLLQVVRPTKYVLRRRWPFPRTAHCSIGFHVYKLDFVSCKWIKMDSLHDRVLFLGQNSSLCLSAPDFPECKPNCIYFTDDFYHRWHHRGPHDMGVFDIEEGAMKPLFEAMIQKSKATPIWIEPMV